jgi:hypothetical protein
MVGDGYGEVSEVALESPVWDEQFFTVKYAKALGIRL